MPEITERLKQLFDYMGFTKYSEFAETTGISHQAASNYIKGKQKPDAEKLSQIQQSFDGLNADWLLTGRGKMFIDDNDRKNQKLSEPIEPYKKNKTTIEDKIADAVEKRLKPYFDDLKKYKKN